MKKIYLVLFVILSIFVFSCKDNLISDDLSSCQNSGVGQVKVFVKQSRLIGPELSDVSWDVLLQKDNENDTISGKNENGYYLFTGLSDGTYNITVFGKINEVEKFTGSAKVTITNGNSVSVNVPIVATKNPNAEVQSTGYATITMDMSEELLGLLNFMGEEACFNANLSISRGGMDAYITASLVKISTDEQGENVSIEFFDNQEVKFENYSSNTNPYEIPTGYYYLTFSDLGSFTIKLKDDLVEIGDGLTTNIVLTQNDYELVQWDSYSQTMPTVFYVDNSKNNHVYDTNDSTNIITHAGLSLSNPLGFTNINDNISGTFYLISDVEAYKEDEENGSKSFPGIEGEENTIASFGSNIFSITNNIYGRFISLYSTTLKNIKLTNTTGAGFTLNWCSVDGTVILDTPIAKNLDSDSDSVVNLYKSSKLVIGQNFSGELGICLFPENWQLGDTVVTFENGVKPSNSNFYISENYDMPTGFASMFYIDDNGKLAQYDATSQWVNFAWNEVAWNEVEPYLITQTQAKNKTYTSIYDSTDGYLYGFNGISTYDEENQTWYFIANGTDGNGYIVPSLYKVSAPTEYTDIVSPEKIEVDGISFDSVQAMAYDNGKLYFGRFDGESVNLYISESANLLNYSVLITSQDYYIGDLTSLLVKGNEVYFATTVTSTNGQNNNPTTHSAIWQLKLEQADDGYNLSPTEIYKNFEGAECPVPYYLTHYDSELIVNDDSFPEGSTFRITDLYSDGNSVYGLLANYEDKVQLQSSHSDIHMRGSVFKLTTNSSRQENSDPIMNANHSGLRKSFPLTSVNLATAKKYFILPRKIVGILNKKLVIVDDGMVPDSNDCNVDRFVLFDLFDLADEISETIDVAVTFSTNGVANTSESRFYTSNSLFN